MTIDELEAFGVRLGNRRGSSREQADRATPNTIIEGIALNDRGRE
jgi:hypothetical protein